MIGIISKNSEIEIVKEFFQLFKVSWEFYNPEKSYEVVISTDDIRYEIDSELTIIFNSKIENLNTVTHSNEVVDIVFDNMSCPIYKSYIFFDDSYDPIITVNGHLNPIGISLKNIKNNIFVIGYDLFAEVKYLLNNGQPPQYSLIPTLDIHVAILRNILIDSGIPVIEIPPVAAETGFTVCLTHDVDFIGIRNHRFDHTLLGFLFRAVIKTPIDFIQRKIAFKKVIRNWVAAFKLPLVFCGMAKDFMITFDKYLEIEKGLSSTFYFIPFKDRCGKGISNTTAPQKRRASYRLEDAAEFINLLIKNGCEIGLHGINAWCSKNDAVKEMAQISNVIEMSVSGVRMHWLYYSKESPNILEECGFLYDTTSGYNETVGYKAGTSQVFLPYGAQRLLELPLHLMDTALFFPARMGLSELEANSITEILFSNADNYGGVLTINWHHRSIGPERLWDSFYEELLRKLKQRKRIWFATGKDAVVWFKKRRETFINDNINNHNSRIISVSVSGGDFTNTPDMILRVHKPHNCEYIIDQNERICMSSYLDIPFSKDIEISVAFRKTRESSFLQVI